MKRFIIVLIVVAAAVGGFFLYRNYQTTKAAANLNYQTVQISKGTLTALIGATGTVRATQTTQVSWQTNGRVGQINILLDDVVKKGQVLASLDKASLSQSIILAESDLVSAQKALEDLQNSEVSTANAQVKLANAEKALIDAKKNRASLNYQKASDAKIDTARADIIIAKDAVKNAQRYYDAFSTRPEDDLNRAQAFSALASAKQRLDKAIVNLNYLESGPKPEDIVVADSKLAQAEADLIAAQRDWDRIKNGPDPRDIRAAEARIRSIETSIAMVDLVAPINGTITQINQMVGDQVGPGTVTFRIDDLTRLLVDVQVPEVDINRVKVGQEAQITYDAALGKQYSGKVIQIAEVGANSAGTVNFTVTIVLVDADADVKPGMTAAVNIVVSQLDDVLLVSNRAVRTLDGKRVIYILQPDNTTKPVQIEIGFSSDSASEIISGDVKEGDVAVLNPTLEPQNGRPPFTR